MAIAAATLALCYLLGSLSGSLLLGRLVGIDIRSRGSGNAGGTNALRTLGWRFALGVVAIDIGKGALAAWIGLLAGSQWPAAGSALPLAFACLMAAVAGHTWPLFFGFRGGKGAGTLVGGLLVLWPLVLLPVLLVWLLLLTSSGYVGLSTVCAALALLPADALLPGGELSRTVFAVIAAGFILFTHRMNLVRLWAGSEHRFERVRLLARLWRRR